MKWSGQEEVLGEFEGFINRHTSNHIRIAGDFNVDFCRASMTLQHLLIHWFHLHER